jgi:hypothetical protein
VTTPTHVHAQERFYFVIAEELKKDYVDEQTGEVPRHLRYIY